VQEARTVRRNPNSMATQVREMPELELAMLKRSVDEIAAGCERCGHCNRTPLVGERVYLYAGGGMLCELCRTLRRERPMQSRLVHGPEFGHAVRIRITDARDGAATAGADPADPS
jgi:hypothetical protein